MLASDTQTAWQYLQTSLKSRHWNCFLLQLQCHLHAMFPFKLGFLEEKALQPHCIALMNFVSLEKAKKTTACLFLTSLYLQLVQTHPVQIHLHSTHWGDTALGQCHTSPHIFIYIWRRQTHPAQRFWGSQHTTVSPRFSISDLLQLESLPNTEN